MGGAGAVDAAAAETIWATYEAYVAAFQARDLERTAPHFQVPLVRFVEGRTIVAGTDADIHEWLCSSFARFEQLGCTRVSLDFHDLQLLDAGLAVLRVKGTRYSREDLPLEGFDVIYTLVRPTASSAWRISGVAAAKPTIERAAVQNAVGRLLSAATSGQPCEPVRHLLGAHDLTSAAAVQQRVTAARVAAGATVVGRKVGHTRPLDGPLRADDVLVLGDLFSDTTYLGGQTVPAEAVMQPRVSAHIGLVLAEDLDDDASNPAMVRAAVAYATPVLEISGSRIRDWDVEACDVVADNACAGAVVLGPVRTPLRGFEPADVTLRMRHGGHVAIDDDGPRIDPIEALGWAAQQARELGRPLRAGELVLTGPLGAPRPFGEGDAVRAVLGSLGAVQFTLSTSSDSVRRLYPSAAPFTELSTRHGS